MHKVLWCIVTKSHQTKRLLVLQICRTCMISITRPLIGPQKEKKRVGTETCDIHLIKLNQERMMGKRFNPP